MTREEAIKILKAIRVYECYPKSAGEETKEALDIAIEALSEINIARDIATILENEQDMRAILQNADRPQGEWINSRTKGYVVCSNCNKLTTNRNREKYNYCPFCGAEICKGGDDK